MKDNFQNLGEPGNLKLLGLNMTDDELREMVVLSRVDISSMIKIVLHNQIIINYKINQLLKQKNESKNSGSKSNKKKNTSGKN